MKLRRDREDYLKTILYLERKKGYVRSLDVAEHMSVTKPSVCYAVRRLQESGLLSMDRDKLLHLTPAGRATAEHVQERYRIIKDGLVSLGVDPETAERDACLVEHVISRETFEKIKAFWEHQVPEKA